MEDKTPIGIKLIIAMYTIAVIASLYMVFFGAEEDRIIGYISAPISLFILIGLFNERSIARIGVLIFSWLAVAISSLLLAIMIWAFFVRGIGDGQTAHIASSLIGEILSIALNAVIIMYLNKSNIKVIFSENS